MNDAQTIDRAAELLAAAKNTERCAIEARIRAELALLELVPCKPEGSTTTTACDWKVTTTGVVNRSVDQVALSAVRDTIPAALFDQAVRYKPELITAGVRYLMANEPGVYAALAQAFSSRPGKTSVVVERIEREQVAA